MINARWVVVREIFKQQRYLGVVWWLSKGQWRGMVTQNGERDTAAVFATERQARRAADENGWPYQWIVRRTKERSVTKPLCSVRILCNDHRHWCSKTAKNKRNGQWYCGIHDPAMRNQL